MGTWRQLMPAQTPVEPPRRPRLPPWSRLRKADIERMERARAAAAAQ
jgi:hypothetical protein